MSTYDNGMDISMNDLNEKSVEVLNETQNDIVQFWSKDLNVLLKYPLEFFPSEAMSYVQKLNALSRIILVLTIGSFIVTRNTRLLFVGGLTLTAIAYMYYVRFTVEEKKMENFELYNKSGNTPGEVLADDQNMDISTVFAEPSSNNPFNNVLISDYANAENKKPAPPAYTDDMKKTIIEQTKNLIAENNPEQPLINNKLFRSLEDDLQFEQSMRPFYSTANTTIPNDQKGFADFCYGSMISCKEGNQFACARNLARHTN
tara:strand:- start:188 stop:964 length:777 start_codon:yes stop_codon:yes gene_type:complete